MVSHMKYENQYDFMQTLRDPKLLTKLFYCTGIIQVGGECAECHNGVIKLKKNKRGCEWQDEKYIFGYHRLCDGCRKLSTLSHGTYFWRSKTKMDDQFSLLFHFCDHRRASDVSRLTLIDRKTVTKYFAFFRRCLSMEVKEYCRDNEIDESAMRKRKHWRGRSYKDAYECMFRRLFRDSKIGMLKEMMIVIGKHQATGAIW